MPESDNFSVGSQMNARTSGTYAGIAASTDKCVFCDLKDKYIVTEKNDLVLTANLFPYADGQTMIIPRRHIERYSEVTPQEAETYFYLSQLAMNLMRAELDIHDIWFILRDGDNAGKTVKHLHWNVMPYQEGLNTWHYQQLTIAPVDLATRLRERLGT